MTTIDQVIERSRQPGAFTKRKRFTVARERAITKMRKFALANPYYYILELIQAAIANGARHIDIQLEKDFIGLSYLGGGFGGTELGQLFDFLFTSKEQLEYADIRQLALGINTLLLAEPREVVIESGMGTLESTTRIRIDSRKNSVEVGTPVQALSGTYIRATAMNRALLGKSAMLKEFHVIEERCLTAPVPIIVNGDPLFGYTTDRTPRLLGFKRYLTFDEGDLYGALGEEEADGKHHFKLLTWGVWIETMERAMLPGVKLGGIVAFDRLNKSADHASIVRDATFKELWARLMPHARRLVQGRGGRANFDVALLDGQVLTTVALRKLLRQERRAVVFPGNYDKRLHARARAFGEALEAPVLIAGEDDIDSIGYLGGEGISIVRPDLKDLNELQLFKQPPAEPPARPWLIGAVRMASVPMAELLSVLEPGPELVEPEQVEKPLAPRPLHELLGDTGLVEAVIYTPQEPAGSKGLKVTLLTTGRRVWSGEVESLYPGYHIVIAVPPISYKKLLFTGQGDLPHCPAELLAREMARRASEKLKTATQRVLAGARDKLQIPSATERRIFIAALARAALLRLRSDGSGNIVPCFSIVDPAVPKDLLDISLFKTLQGRPLALRGLAHMMAEGGGLLYGVIPEITPDLSGLDTSRILDLDLFQERMLISIVGAAGYVRLDGREVLAAHRGTRIRDMALGLRNYPDFPLLVEGSDPTEWSEDRQRETEDHLVKALLKLLEGIPATPEEVELRRQALRHLQWYLVTAVQGKRALPQDSSLRGLPLFSGAGGESYSFREIEERLFSTEGATMQDGWAEDDALHGWAKDGAPSSRAKDRSAPERDEEKPGRAAKERILAMNPFVLHILGRLGRVRPALDIDLSAGEAAAHGHTPDQAFIEKIAVDNARFSGIIGLPTVEVAKPAIAIIDRDNRVVTSLCGSPGEPGISGWFQLKNDGALASEHTFDKEPPADGRDRSREELARLTRLSKLEFMTHLFDRLPALSPQSGAYRPILGALLDFAALNIKLTAQPDGGIAIDILNYTAERILDLPLFKTSDKLSLSANRLLKEFTHAQSHGRSESLRSRLDDSAPEFLRHWLGKVLSEDRIIRPASKPKVPSDRLDTTEGLDNQKLGLWLSEVIERLRPDRREPGEAPLKVMVVRVDNDEVWLDGFFPFRMEATDLKAFIQDEQAPLMVLNDHHWLMQYVKRQVRHSPQVLAWLLFSLYAHLNNLLEPVRNTHELEFQRRVLELLGEEGPFLLKQNTL